MTTIRTVIVDDEPLARDKLRSFLTRHPALELVGEAGDGREAVRVIDAVNPDLLLLDIQMPELDGLEVLAAVTRELEESEREEAFRLRWARSGSTLDGRA